MTEKYLGQNTPKLGFGLMRLPKIDGKSDVAETSRMVDLFLDAGFTYFDTAFVYGDSEETAKKALVERYPRDSYTLATKINLRVAESEEFAKSEFATSLTRTGAGFFDYYLLHGVMGGNYEKYAEWGIWDFVREKKEQGLVKHCGFSFHGDAPLLDRLLTEYPWIEFVQLQINYADWENPDVTSRAVYETARKHGKSIVIMEPVKGGKLADPPEEVKKIFKAVNPDASYASWAIRFAASLDGVIAVLSGMSNLEQMQDNISYMKNFVPLNEEERIAIREAQKILGHDNSIPCTACRYCVDGCPQSIAIPDIFAAMNKRRSDGLLAESADLYAAAAAKGGKASDCVACGQCEEACPQHLQIIDLMKECAETFD